MLLKIKMVQKLDSPNLVLSNSTYRQLKPPIIGGPTGKLDAISWRPRNIWYYFGYSRISIFRNTQSKHSTNVVIPKPFISRLKITMFSLKLRTIKIINYKIFRILRTGESQYLHPKDNVFLEKVNIKRQPIGKLDSSIGKKFRSSVTKISYMDK